MLTISVKEIFKLACSYTLIATLKSTMGGIFSFISINSNESVVHSNSGLSVKQKKLMRKTWDEFIRPNVIGVGVHAMLRLFDNHPDIKNMFADFKDVPYNQLECNKKFHAHCQMIMTTVSNAVDAFLCDDVELFTTMLAMSGERHAKRAAGTINAQQFECVKKPLLDTLQLYMKSRWTNEVSDLWTQAITKTIDSIISGINIHYDKMKCDGANEEQQTTP